MMSARAGLRLLRAAILAALGVSIETKVIRHRHGRIMRNKTRSNRVRTLRQFGERWVCLGKFWVIVY